jgi:hypothetical protein
VAIVVLLAVWGSATGAAAAIVDFKPTPTSASMPEFVFDRALGGGTPVFRAGLGATSNNDGNLPIANQTAPGLDAETPFILAGPGALNDLIAGTTHFLDSSLQFTGLAANAPAIFAGGTFVQPLSSGTFQLLSTGPAPVLLLSGNIAGSVTLTGVGNAGAVFSASTVTYTGGIIFNAMVANSHNVNGGSFSISMVDVSPNFGIVGDGFLGDFNANATGLFSEVPVPEPAMLSALLPAAGALLRLGRRR